MFLSEVAKKTLTRADLKALAQDNKLKNSAEKKNVINKLKVDLKKLNIKYEVVNATRLAIYNDVTRTAPIFFLVGSPTGGFDIVDDTNFTVRLMRDPDAIPLYNFYNDRRKTTHSTTYVKPDDIMYELSPSLEVVGDHYRTRQIKRKFRGIIYKFIVRSVRKAKDGTLYYPSKFKVNEDGDKEIVKLEELKGTTIIPYEKKDFDGDGWGELLDTYFEGRKLFENEAYEVSLKYLLAIFDSSTVNASISGGKNKYLIDPAEMLYDALIKEYGQNAIVSCNLDDVSNKNAINPTIVISPKEHIKLRIIMRKIGKGVETAITNIDKMMLYVDTRANLKAIKDRNYYGIPVATIDVIAYKDLRDGKWYFNYDPYKIIDRINAYLDKVETYYEKAIQNRKEFDEYNAKLRKIIAAEKEEKAKQEAEDAKRIAKQEAEEAERNRKLTVDQAASEVFGSNDNYNSFIDDLVNNAFND